MLKSICCLALSGLFFQGLQAQASGNVNRAAGNVNVGTKDFGAVYPENNINATFKGQAPFTVSVKGMANLKADEYVAIFCLSQTAPTAVEVEKLMTERLESVLKELKPKPEIKTFVDMVSFVPMYEFESEKKIFSKRTYNEVPKGFELKKNLHIRFNKAEQLDELVSVCAQHEVYDLVRVDYISHKMEATKQELAKRSDELLKAKILRYEGLLGLKFNEYELMLTDEYRVLYPVEMYRSYQAYSASSLSYTDSQSGKGGRIQRLDKGLSLYYQPVMDKEFDFVLNPSILEPVIQVLYELKVQPTRKKEKEGDKPLREYYIIGTNGQLQKLSLPN